MGGGVGGEARAVPDVDMSRAPGLPPHEDAAPQPRAAREPALRGDDRKIPHLAVVRDHDEIVDLHAPADPGDSRRGAIDRRQRADLDVVADLDRSDLRDLLHPSLLIRRVPEAVRSDHDAVVQDHAVAQAGGAKRDMAPDAARLAQDDAGAHEGKRAHLGPRADHRAFLDHREGTDARRGIDAGGRVDDGGGVHPGGGGRRGEKSSKRPREGKLGEGRPQGGKPVRRGAGRKDRRRRAAPGQRGGPLRAHGESHRARAGVLKPRHGHDLDLAVPLEIAPDDRCEILELHGSELYHAAARPGNHP